MGYVTAITLVGCSIGIIFHYQIFIQNDNAEDKEAVFLSKLLMKHGVQTCYDKSRSFYYFYPALEFYYKQSKQNIVLTIGAVNSIRHKSLLASDNYDAIVYDLSDSSIIKQADYKLLYSDSSNQFKVLIKSILPDSLLLKLKSN